MNSDPDYKLEYPGISESDPIARVIEKQGGMKVTIFASGSVVVRPKNAPPKTHLPDGRVLKLQDGEVVDITPKRRAPLRFRPLNVASHAEEEIGRQLSNFTARRFTLDGKSYASVEGWYQGLKWPEAAKRAEIAKLSGSAAKNAAKGAPKSATFMYLGATYVFGSAEHHTLVKMAIAASLSQSPKVKALFVKTHPRPIIHDLGRPEPPETSLPGAKFARILEEIREEFRQDAVTPQKP